MASLHRPDGVLEQFLCDFGDNPAFVNDYGGIDPRGIQWRLETIPAADFHGAQTSNAKKPLIGMCDSTRCPQATHHACHRPVWAEHQTTTKVFLGNLGRGHRAERERLEADLARCEHVLAEIDTGFYPGKNRDGSSPLAPTSTSPRSSAAACKPWKRPARSSTHEPRRSIGSKLM
ncbi:hypothetical protein [Streptomyces sp. SS]|uniref:hypothetical protein n=1 Tax=Streptomyces sp. SS TaxID=260742 RepID=UPI00037C4168|nr:hypothetical protein [Streptomyces sp. SS]